MNKQNILIYALDSEYAVVGVVDEFTCFQYTASWTGIGDWTITLNASQKADIDALKAAEFIRVDGIGAGIITKITEDIQPSGRSYKVQGVQLKGLAQKRIVMNTDALTGKPCEICEQLLVDNLLEPTNVKRKIPGIITAVQDVGDDIEYTAKYDVLSDTLQELCETYDLGWDAALDDDGIHWYIKAGVDRTLGQTVNEALLIGYDVDTLDAATYEQTKDVKNTAIVGGSGEGASRTIEIVGDDNAGLARTELFVEARSEDDLAAKGSEALSAYGTDNILETKPSELLLHRFLDGEFAIGDVGTLIDHDNVSCRLTECVYIFEGNSIEIRFSYGYGVQTIADAIKAATSNYSALLKSEGTGGGSWETITGVQSEFDGSGQKKRVNGIVFLRGAFRYTPELAQSSYATFVTDIGVGCRPTERTVLPLAGDYAGFLLYVNTDGSVQIRNRTGASRTNMWFAIDASYTI